MVDALSPRHRQHIRASSFFEPGSQTPRRPVDRIRHYPSRGHSRLKCPPEHLFGQLTLGRKPDLIGNSGLLSPEGIIRPLLARQVQSTIHERSSFLRSISHEHPDLGVLDAPRGPRVLASHPNRLLAFLQKASLIHDEYPALLLAQVLDDVFVQVVTDGIGIPAGSVEEALRPLRTQLAHSFGHLPAVLALHAPEKAGEVAPRSLPYLRPVETLSDTGVQLAKGIQPPFDGGEFAASTSGFLRCQMRLLCWLEEHHTVVQWKCRCRTRSSVLRSSRQVSEGGIMLPRWKESARQASGSERRR